MSANQQDTPMDSGNTPELDSEDERLLAMGETDSHEDSDDGLDEAIAQLNALEGRPAGLMPPTSKTRMPAVPSLAPTSPVFSFGTNANSAVPFLAAVPSTSAATTNPSPVVPSTPIFTTPSPSLTTRTTEEMDQQLKQAWRDNATLNEENARLSEKLATERRRNEDRMTGDQDTINDNETARQTQSDELQQLRNELKIEKEANQSAVKRGDKLYLELTETQSSKDKVEKFWNDSKTARHALEKEMKETQATADQRATQAHEFKSAAERAQAASQRAQVELAQLKPQLEHLIRRNPFLEEQHRQQTAEIAELQARYDDSQAVIARQNADVVSLQNAMQNVGQGLHGHESSMAAAQARIESLTQDNQRLRNERDHAQTIAGSLQGERNTAQAFAQAMRQERDLALASQSSNARPLDPDAMEVDTGDNGATDSTSPMDITSPTSIISAMDAQQVDQSQFLSPTSPSQHGFGGSPQSFPTSPALSDVARGHFQSLDAELQGQTSPATPLFGSVAAGGGGGLPDDDDDDDDDHKDEGDKSPESRPDALPRADSPPKRSRMPPIDRRLDPSYVPENIEDSYFTLGSLLHIWRTRTAGNVNQTLFYKIVAETKLLIEKQIHKVKAQEEENRLKAEKQNRLKEEEHKRLKAEKESIHDEPTDEPIDEQKITLAQLKDIAEEKSNVPGVSAEMKWKLQYLLREYRDFYVAEDRKQQQQVQETATVQHDRSMGVSTNQSPTTEQATPVGTTVDKSIVQAAVPQSQPSAVSVDSQVSQPQLGSSRSDIQADDTPTAISTLPQAEPVDLEGAFAQVAPMDLDADAALLGDEVATDEIADVDLSLVLKDHDTTQESTEITPSSSAPAISEVSGSQDQQLQPDQDMPTAKAEEELPVKQPETGRSYELANRFLRNSLFRGAESSDESESEEETPSPTPASAPRRRAQAMASPSISAEAQAARSAAARRLANPALTETKSVGVQAIKDVQASGMQTEEGIDMEVEIVIQREVVTVYQTETIYEIWESSPLTVRSLRQALLPTGIRYLQLPNGYVLPIPYPAFTDFLQPILLAFLVWYVADYLFLVEHISHWLAANEGTRKMVIAAQSLGYGSAAFSSSAHQFATGLVHVTSASVQGRANGLLSFVFFVLSSVVGLIRMFVGTTGVERMSWGLEAAMQSGAHSSLSLMG